MKAARFFHHKTKLTNWLDKEKRKYKSKIKKTGNFLFVDKEFIRTD